MLRALSWLASAIVVALAVAAQVQAQAPIPDGRHAGFMVKTTIVALNHANVTGNYTVLRDLGSPRFRANNTAARLAVVFTPLRERGIDLSPIVDFEPVLTQPISSDAQGRLTLSGYIPTRPLRVVFNLAYEPIDNRWMLSDIATDLAPWPDDSTQSGGGQKGDFVGGREPEQ